jgi:hypothetical protein
LFRVIFAVRFSLSAVCRYTSLLLLPVALHSPSILVLSPFLPTRTSILPHSLAHTTHLASSFPQETSNCHRNNNTPCPITTDFAHGLHWSSVPDLVSQGEFRRLAASQLLLLWLLLRRWSPCAAWDKQAHTHSYSTSQAPLGVRSRVKSLTFPRPSGIFFFWLSSTTSSSLVSFASACNFLPPILSTYCFARFHISKFSK